MTHIPYDQAAKIGNTLGELQPKQPIFQVNEITKIDWSFDWSCAFNDPL